INPAAQPGFNFNTTAPLGSNPVVNPGIVGFQGLGNLGVGRQSPTAGVGGFVFSAASNTFNLLIRALKTQGRIEVLSRPLLMTLDSQTSEINIGQRFPIVTGSTIGVAGTFQSSVEYIPVGVILRVTPRISPDGSVVMRVHPEISSVQPTQIPLGNGQVATAFNAQVVETTIAAQDGETVAIGGLIAKRDEKRENKIPWLGDLPYVGAAFRYRTHTKERRELMVILTPHVVRNRFDADRILAEESKRISWCLGDVVNIHGTHGMEPILYPQGAPAPYGVPSAGSPAPVTSPSAPLPTAPASQPALPRPSAAPAPPPQPGVPQPGAPAPAPQSQAPANLAVPTGAAAPYAPSANPDYRSP